MMDRDFIEFLCFFGRGLAPKGRSPNKTHELALFDFSR